MYYDASKEHGKFKRAEAAPLRHPNKGRSSPHPVSKKRRGAAE